MNTSPGLPAWVTQALSGCGSISPFSLLYPSISVFSGSVSKKTAFGHSAAFLLEPFNTHLGQTFLPLAWFQPSLVQTLLFRIFYSPNPGRESAFSGNFYQTNSVASSFFPSPFHIHCIRWHLQHPFSCLRLQKYGNKVPLFDLNTKQLAYDIGFREEDFNMMMNYKAQSWVTISIPWVKSA